MRCVNAADAVEIAGLAGVDPRVYSVEGERHEALCLVASGQTWHVFLSERGNRYEERVFDAQDDACVHCSQCLW